MRWFCYSLPLALLVAVGTLPAQAQLTSPQIGWEAELSTLFENVSGTVSILDEDTLQFDNFTFDGGGLSIYFYLGTADNPSAFSTGLQIGEELLGSAFDGTQEPFSVDLPVSQTLEGWNAISVWCVTAGVNFGSGSFMAVGGPSADFDGDGDVDGADFLLWQRGGSPDPFSDSDLAAWKANYGTVAPLSATATAVPEPATWIVLMLGMATTIFCRDKGVVFHARSLG